MPANLENSAVATGQEKVSFHSNPKERQCQECTNYSTIALISLASKVMLKILQVRLKQYMNWELPDAQTGFRKGRRARDQIDNIYWFIQKQGKFQMYKLGFKEAEEPEIKLPTSVVSGESKGVPEKYVLVLHWLHQILWLCVSQQAVENSSVDGIIRPPYLSPEKLVCRSRSNS